MNLDKEIKIKLISCINEASDKKEEIKNKLLLKPKERRKNLNKVRKIKNKNIIKSGRKKRVISQIDIMINILQIT